MAIINIKHSRVSYYADFAFYLIAILALCMYLIVSLPKGVAVSTVIMSIIAGFIAWSGVEYAMHRFIFHGIEPFSRLHDEHHKHPKALIATPTYISASLIALLFWLPVSLVLGFWLGSAITLGFISGYFLYGVLHHAVHNWRFNNSWLRKRKRLHAIHHRYPNFNYGVTQSIWDSFFLSLNKV